MPRSSKFAPLAALVIAATLFGGLLYLLEMRFEVGDVYPPYSSLRSDPLGTRVLHDALASCTGLTVSRLYEPLMPDRADALSKETVLLFLGDTFSPRDSDRLAGDTADALGRFMTRGGRIAITFQPTQPEHEQPKPKQETNDSSETDSTNAVPVDAESQRAESSSGKVPPPEEDQVPFSEPSVKVSEWMGAKVLNSNTSNAVWAVRGEDAPDAFPERILCRSAAYLDELSDAWTVLYTATGRPVVAERRWGAGSLAVCVPSYFVSNEAMRKARRTELLTWLIGNHTCVMFDEYHHGVALHRGVAMLARRYHLEGVGAGLVLLALLFVWRNATSLVPPYRTPGETHAGVQTGKDSMQGLDNLLRRNLTGAELLRTCVDEWSHAFVGPAATYERLKTTLKRICENELEKPVHKRNLPHAYNQMAAAVNTREHGGNAAQSEDAKGEQHGHRQTPTGAE